MARTFKPDPNDVLDYGFNYTSFLSENEVIIASTWTLDPDDDTLTAGSAGFNDTHTTIWISGGTPGVTYKLVNHVVTDQGREKDRTFSVLPTHV